MVVVLVELIVVVQQVIMVVMVEVYLVEQQVAVVALEAWVVLRLLVELVVVPIAEPSEKVG